MARTAAAISEALKTLPQEAVPGMLNVLLQATGTPPSVLLSLLLENFNANLEPTFDNLNGMALQQNTLMSKKDDEADWIYLERFNATLLHLLKSTDSDLCCLDSVISTFWIPILREANRKGLSLSFQVTQSVAEVVAAHNAWASIQCALFPLCLSSILGGLDLKVETANFDWMCSTFEHMQLEKLVKFQQAGKNYDQVLPLSTVCQLVSTVLTKALSMSETHELGQLKSTKEVQEVKTTPVQQFCQAAVSLFWYPGLLMFSQSLDGSVRRLAIDTLLPPLIRAANILGEPDGLQERQSPNKQVWLCCKFLFSRHSFERRDAYMALTVFKFFLIPSVGEPKDIHSFDQGFDVRNDSAFWDELRAGLVDEDPLTRKRAMHVLKIALHTSGSSQIKFNLQDNIQEPSLVGLKEKHIVPGHTMKPLRKREKWEKQEAESLGIRTFREEAEINDESQWTAFWHLYEALEEYGIHLLEAAWEHQMSKIMKVVLTRVEESILQMRYVNFVWTAVLWERGFKHGNPQVRRLVLHSFLELDWEGIPNVSTVVPEEFVLGPLLLALNDQANYNKFGSNEDYESKASKNAAKFIYFYSSGLQKRSRVNFVFLLAKSSLSQSPCRAGLMTLACCIEAAAINSFKSDSSLQNSDVIIARKSGNGVIDKISSETKSIKLLEALRLVMEACKCHYNPKYRAKVYTLMLTAASTLVTLTEVSIEKFGHFLTTIPRDLFSMNGLLFEPLRFWLKSDCCIGNDQPDPRKWVANGLHSLISTYFKSHNSCSASYEISEEEFKSWKLESERWARLFVISSLEEDQQLQLLQFVQDHAAHIDQRAYVCPCLPVKVLLLISSLLEECPPIETLCRTAEDHESTREHISNIRVAGVTSLANIPLLTALVAKFLGSIMDELISYASRTNAIFWEYKHSGSWELPSSLIGRLGGPSQRRLPVSTNSAVLKAVLATTTVAYCTVWLHDFQPNDISDFTTNFLWSFAWKVVAAKSFQQEMEAEVQLGALEALCAVCNALAVTASPLIVSSFIASAQFETNILSGSVTSANIVDSLVRSLVVETNGLMAKGGLARSRIAVLVHYKWCCLDSLLSMASSSVCSISKGRGTTFMNVCAIFDPTMLEILEDGISSLDHAGEDTLLYILRSLRWLIHWKGLEIIGKRDDVQNSKCKVVWALVRSGWTALSNSNKRKVALISAFLSTMLHRSIFAEPTMHQPGDGLDAGPLKWLIERLMEQGIRSPRTMRLTALHLTGLWLAYPGIACLYISELQSLSLHGGESVDEELEGEIVESKVAAREYNTLMSSSDPELIEVFTHTEMYVRLTIAVLMHKMGERLPDAPAASESKSSRADMHPFNCGQNLLLALLSAAANDEDLSKELYKKKSVIHRRKIRVWQMLCIVSRFLSDSCISRVLPMLELCLYRNNMASVRQYIELFAAQLYLQFPSLVYDHLIPLLLNYNLKTQALSSYVSIASNVVMHISPVEVQKDMLQVIFPAIFSYITSHHHNLRGFSQVIVHQFLNQFAIPKPCFEENFDGRLDLGQKCLDSVAAYLEGNTDCTRMRTSVEKYLNVLDPFTASTPRGIFCFQSDEVDSSKIMEFECVPPSMLDQIGHFLNVARDELRESMTADSITLSAQEYAEFSTIPQHQLSLKNKCASDGSEAFKLAQNNSMVSDEYKLVPSCKDFQRKIKPFDDKMLCRDNSDEDDFLLRTVEARIKDLMRAQGERQNLIVVASLIERIPNLAGLARTCEVFKIACLAVADKKITEDKQFQMISVTAEQWVPILQVPVASLEQFLQLKRKEGYLLVGLEQTAYSIPISDYKFPKNVVLLLGKEKDGIPVDLIQTLDACIEIPQLGVIRSLNVHVSGALAIWEYTKYHQSMKRQLTS